MLTFLTVGLASFIGVFFKAFQQLNVMHHQIGWILPVSYVMAASEVFVITQVAMTMNPWLIFPLGTGAGIGCISSMLLHKRLRQRKENIEEQNAIEATA